LTDYFTTAKNCLAASFQQQQVFIYQGIPKRSVTAEDTCVHHHTLVRKPSRNKWKLRGSP